MTIKRATCASCSDRSLLFALAALVGLGATYFALTRGAAFGALTHRRLDRLAENRHRGRRPLRAGGHRAERTVADRARRRRVLHRAADDSGRLLDGRCDVVLSGTTPAARFWTITLYNAAGQLVANSVNRFGFTSQEIVRQRRRHLRDRGRAARQRRQLAADRRHRALRRWCCASTIRRSASRPAPARKCRCPPSRRGAAHDPLGAAGLLGGVLLGGIVHLPPS